MRVVVVVVVIGMAMGHADEVDDARGHVQ